jgi:hypothetical protein
MSELKFEIAAQDKEAALGRDYLVTVFELPNRDGTGVEQYAAVRPADAAWVAVTATAYMAHASEKDQILRGMSFLDQCLNEDDVRRGLIADKAGRWRPQDDDELQDEELSDAGVELWHSNTRLSQRLMDGGDPFGVTTLAQIMGSLVERWSGNPTGQPQDYLPPQRNTGKSSTGTRSSKASISSRSSTSRRRGSSPQSVSD